MTIENEVIVSYKDDFAEAKVGDGTIRIAAHDTVDRKSLCPVELISAALGT